MSQQGTSTNPLIAFASGLENWFKQKVQQVEQFADALLPEVENDVEVALDDLIGIAGQAVLDQAGSVLAGAEKFGAAVTSVIQTVEGAGKTVAIQTAQMAVQQAYLTAQQQAKAAQSGN
jgi:hypothetical protein